MMYRTAMDSRCIHITWYKDVSRYSRRHRVNGMAPNRPCIPSGDNVDQPLTSQICAPWNDSNSNHTRTALRVVRFHLTVIGNCSVESETHGTRCAQATLACLLTSLVQSAPLRRLVCHLHSPATQRSVLHC